jgi:hypothetical protein
MRLVHQLLRAGEQTGYVEYDSEKLTPAAASESIAGVLKYGFPWADIALFDCWSVSRTRMFGFRLPAADRLLAAAAPRNALLL